MTRSNNVSEIGQRVASLTGNTGTITVGVMLQAVTGRLVLQKF
ncbi:hypothetical protein [Synechococcus sp. PCC 7502]|nr:hypothetical protein [Synechococcus sp. PCC 7502]